MHIEDWGEGLAAHDNHPRPAETNPTLPMHRQRQLPGGLGEFMRLRYQDAVLSALERQVVPSPASTPSPATGSSHDG